LILKYQPNNVKTVVVKNQLTHFTLIHLQLMVSLITVEIVITTTTKLKGNNTIWLINLNNQCQF
jgi:hypothetical protein